jgi:6-O-methylguanine DNA methyltransferase, DNA binding domain
VNERGRVVTQRTNHLPGAGDPNGFVRTYGDIDPLAPRLVGRVLSQTHDLPWHRVVRADGTLPHGEAQRKLLVAEGVPKLGPPCVPDTGEHDAGNGLRILGIRSPGDDATLPA